MPFPPAGNPLYVVLMVAGIALGAMFWLRHSSSDPALPFIYFGGLAFAFLGAKLAFLFAEGWLHVDDPNRWTIWLSGKSVMGALPGGWLGVEVIKRVIGYHKITGDRFASILPVPLILGRVGCLSAGCCGGISCSSGRWPAVPVEIGFQVLALALLAGMRRSKCWPGQHFHLYLIGYGTFRFAHEFLRSTPKPFWGLSGYQIIALGTAMAAAIAFRVRARRQLPV